MLSKGPAKSHPSSSRTRAKAGADTPVLDPRSIIETASGGDGTINDQGGTDNKPPRFGGGSHDPLRHLMG
jgi:hypothetical protein